MKSDEEEDEKRALQEHQEYEPTKVKIPRVKNGVYPVHVYKTTQTYNHKGQLLVTIKPQIIDGQKFEKTTIYVNWNLPAATIMISSDVLNNILRVQFFDSLRTVKKERDLKKRQ